MSKNKIKVVINNRYGGFFLSQKAILKLIEIGWTTTTFTSDHRPLNNDADILIKDGKYGITSEKYNINWFKLQTDNKSFRTNNDVIQVVELLGQEASAQGSEIIIEEIEEDEDNYFWNIKSYDGHEKIVYNKY